MKERRKEYRRMYAIAHREQLKGKHAERWKHWLAHKKSVWGERLKSDPLLDRKAEELAVSILEGEGFSSLSNFNSLTRAFSFDLVGYKEGNVCVFEITTCSTKHRAMNKFQIASLLRAEFYMLFLNPKLDSYVLRKVDKARLWECLTLKEMLNAKPVSGIANIRWAAYNNQIILAGHTE